MNITKIIMAGTICLLVMPVMAKETLECMSSNHTLTSCDLSNAKGRNVQLSRVIAGNCDNAWGVNKDSIWVDKGCGAVFIYDPISSTSGSSNVLIAPVIAPFYEPYYYNGPEGVVVYDGYGNYHPYEYNEYNKYHGYPRNDYHPEAHPEEFHGAEGFHGGGRR